MKEYTHIKIEIYNDTGIIYLNRPEKGNALNILMIREFASAISEIETYPEVRFIILRGKGKHFCSGADLEWMAAAAELSMEENTRESLELAGIFERIYLSEKLTIAHVHGACYGGGIGLATACDFVYAGAEAKFSFGESRLGLVPAVIAPFVSNRTGTYKAKQLMLKASVIDADEALKTGLVDSILTDDQANHEVEELLGLLRKGSPSAQMSIKKLLNSLTNETYREEIKVLTSELIAGTRISKEGREGITAFLEKRQPNWLKS